MKRLIFFVKYMAVSAAIISCSGGKKPADTEKEFRMQVLKAAEAYASGMLSNPVSASGAGGAVIVSDNSRKLIVEPSKIFTGKLNEDELDDAIITLTSVRNNQTDILVHLVVISEADNCKVVQAIESDMKILNISNSLVTVQVPTHARTSPLFNCASCQEIQQYRFSNGMLEKLEINKQE